MEVFMKSSLKAFVIFLCVALIFSGPASAYGQAGVTRSLSSSSTGASDLPASKDSPTLDKMMVFLGVASNLKEGERAFDVPINVFLGTEMDVKKSDKRKAADGKLVFMKHTYPLKLKEADDFKIDAEIFKVEKKAPGEYTDVESAAKPSVFKIGTLKFEPVSGDGTAMNESIIDRAFVGELKIKPGNEIDSPKTTLKVFLRIHPAPPEE
jgi:hypothetical protein